MKGYLSPENNSLQMAGLTHGPCNNGSKVNRKKKSLPPLLDFFSLSLNISFPPYVIEGTILTAVLRIKNVPALYCIKKISLNPNIKRPLRSLIGLGFYYLKYKSQPPRIYKTSHWLLHNYKNVTGSNQTGWCTWGIYNMCC
jgi:hypothetical protein